MSETPAPSSATPKEPLPIEEEEGPFERRPHWSLRLLMHMLKVALMMGIAFALASFAVLLYVSDFRQNTSSTLAPNRPAQTETAPLPSTEPSSETPDEAASRILRWMFGN